jgi:hypothetical protein
MKLEDEIAKIMEITDGLRKTAEIIRGQQEELLGGKEVSDFMLSFSVVRKVDDLIKHNEENAYYAGLVG